MTIGPPAPAGLALAPDERPVGVNPPGGFRFDSHLQGDQETVFFDV
jgi:hypothetical protein